MINNKIYYKLRTQIETITDIREHLLTLMFYAFECKHITEMGVRDVVSTWAFLAAKPNKPAAKEWLQAQMAAKSTAGKMNQQSGDAAGVQQN